MEPVDPADHAAPAGRVVPAGVLDEVVNIPASKVTACTFGGDQRDELFITHITENIDTDSDPLAGSLFRVDAGVRGLPVREFAGCPCLVTVRGVLRQP